MRDYFLMHNLLNKLRIAKGGVGEFRVIVADFKVFGIIGVVVGEELLGGARYDVNVLA